MSEFTNNAEQRAEELANYMQELLQGENGLQLIEKHALKTSKFIPHDIVGAFDILMDKQISIEDLKFVSNKLFNILYQTILEYPALTPAQGSILDIYTQDNAVALANLKDMREHIKAINKQAEVVHVQALMQKLIAFEKFFLHYTVIENVVFPVLESKWRHHQCVKIMWSFHDDIRRNVRKLIEILETPEIDLQEFNSTCGLVFFNVNTIILREEKIIFPMLLETLTNEEFAEMLQQTIGIGLPYAELKQLELKNAEHIFSTDDKIHLPTGVLTAEQFNLIFNHLSVDITYVDENDTVRFYSNPPHRIFPRTPAIIGRKVQFCHPPESVHVVERIVESFRTGEKDVASFWFHMGPKFILIQYFAVRNENNEYKGTLEVSQEISEIQSISGDRKLLDW
ncbi:MAG: PAS domain-containing protein [Paludibacter sp.]|nr:PAS domain-containing protein [Paludibacter sp.]